MSEEQNDSPAFRLRPRRAAPKSYYTVRLEYSANPAAFIRERPRTSSKLRVFSRKTGSTNATTGSGLNQGPAQLKPAAPSKEEQEREERRMMLHRDSASSITTDTMISPFMQRLHLDELEPDSVYEHNYITLKIKQVEQSSNGRLLICLCQSIDSPNKRINVRLYNEYADTSLVKPEKIMSIAKFRTGPVIDNEPNAPKDNNNIDSPLYLNPHNNGHTIAASNKLIQIAQAQHTSTRGESSRSPSVKSETEEAHRSISRASDSTEPLGRQTPSPSVSPSMGLSNLVPFHVIVRFDELVARATSNSNRSNSMQGVASGSSGVATSGSPSVSRRPLVPFVSITSDMIEQPEEPYVEMSPPSPEATSNRPIGNNRRIVDDHENVDVKKVKFTANSL